MSQAQRLLEAVESMHKESVKSEAIKPVGTILQLLRLYPVLYKSIKVFVDKLLVMLRKAERVRVK
tara:strand:+ start:1100 stop:1294 length:195 start_codon:yes stop_codon:yes gene_type:complete